MVSISIYIFLLKLNFLSNGKRFLFDILGYYATLWAEKTVKLLQQTLPLSFSYTACPNVTLLRFWYTFCQLSRKLWKLERSFKRHLTRIIMFYWYYKNEVFGGSIESLEGFLCRVTLLLKKIPSLGSCCLNSNFLRKSISKWNVSRANYVQGGK